jgi:2-haloacid dehalogenase
MGPVRAVVFDLGGVLIDWDPRYLYRQLFDGREAEMEAFLTLVTTKEWNHRQDAGRPWAEAVEELGLAHPEQRDLIEAYASRWEEMLGGAIEGTVAILAELRDAGVPLYALSNWSAETFPRARAMYDFLGWFDGTVISGELGITKPDPRIYEHLLETFDLEAAQVFFTDDLEVNVEAARALGIEAVVYRGPEPLRRDLVAAGFLS